MYSDVLRIYPEIQKRLQAENMFTTSPIYAIMFATYYRLVCCYIWQRYNTSKILLEYRLIIIFILFLVCVEYTNTLWAGIWIVWRIEEIESSYETVSKIGGTSWCNETKKTSTRWMSWNSFDFRWYWCGGSLCANFSLCTFT